MIRRGRRGAAQTTTTQAPRIWVQVAGAVHVPGVYQLGAGSRVFEAVAAAGGFADDADQQAVAQAALLSDGCRVYVPKVGETVGGAVLTPAAVFGRDHGRVDRRRDRRAA